MWRWRACVQVRTHKNRGGKHKINARSPGGVRAVDVIACGFNVPPPSPVLLHLPGLHLFREKTGREHSIDIIRYTQWLFIHVPVGQSVFFTWWQVAITDGSTHPRRRRGPTRALLASFTPAIKECLAAYSLICFCFGIQWPPFNFLLTQRPTIPRNDDAAAAVDAPNLSVGGMTTRDQL